MRKLTSFCLLVSLAGLLTLLTGCGTTAQMLEGAKVFLVS